MDISFGKPVCTVLYFSVQPKTLVKVSFLVLLSPNLQRLKQNEGIARFRVIIDLLSFIVVSCKNYCLPPSLPRFYLTFYYFFFFLWTFSGDVKPLLRSSCIMQKPSLSSSDEYNLHTGSCLKVCHWHGTQHNALRMLNPAN